MGRFKLGSTIPDELGFGFGSGYHTSKVGDDIADPAAEPGDITQTADFGNAWQAYIDLKWQIWGPFNFGLQFNGGNVWAESRKSSLYYCPPIENDPSGEGFCFDIPVDYAHWYLGGSAFVDISLAPGLDVAFGFGPQYSNFVGNPTEQGDVGSTVLNENYGLGQTLLIDQFHWNLPLSVRAQPVRWFGNVNPLLDAITVAYTYTPAVIRGEAQAIKPSNYNSLPVADLSNTTQIPGIGMQNHMVFVGLTVQLGGSSPTDRPQSFLATPMFKPVVDWVGSLSDNRVAPSPDTDRDGIVDADGCPDDLPPVAPSPTAADIRAAQEILTQINETILKVRLRRHRKMDLGQDENEAAEIKLNNDKTDFVPSLATIYSKFHHHAGDAPTSGTIKERAEALKVQMLAEVTWHDLQDQDARNNNSFTPEQFATGILTAVPERTSAADDALKVACINYENGIKADDTEDDYDRVKIIYANLGLISAQVNRSDLNGQQKQKLVLEAVQAKLNDSVYGPEYDTLRTAVHQGLLLLVDVEVPAVGAVAPHVTPPVKYKGEFVFKDSNGVVIPNLKVQLIVDGLPTSVTTDSQGKVSGEWLDGKTVMVIVGGKNTDYKQKVHSEKIDGADFSVELQLEAIEAAVVAPVPTAPTNNPHVQQFIRALPDTAPDAWVRSILDSSDAAKQKLSDLFNKASEAGATEADIATAFTAFVTTYTKHLHVPAEERDYSNPDATETLGQAKHAFYVFAENGTDVLASVSSTLPNSFAEQRDSFGSNFSAHQLYDELSTRQQNPAFYEELQKYFFNTTLLETEQTADLDVVVTKKIFALYDNKAKTVASKMLQSDFWTDPHKAKYEDLYAVLTHIADGKTEAEVLDAIAPQTNINTPVTVPVRVTLSDNKQNVDVTITVKVDGVDKTFKAKSGQIFTDIQLKPGDYEFFVSAGDDYRTQDPIKHTVEASDDDIPAEDTFEITLQAIAATPPRTDTGTIVITVKDSITRQPVEGAEIVIENLGDDAKKFSSNADGVITATGIDSAIFDSGLKVTRTNYDDYTIPTFNLDAGETETFNIVMVTKVKTPEVPKTAELRFQVADADSGLITTYLKDAKVTIIYADTTIPPLTLTSDNDGNVRSDAILANQDFKIKVEMAGYETYTSPTNHKITATASLSPVELKKAKPPTEGFVVRGTSGEVIPYAKVRLVPDDIPGKPYASSLDATADVNGVVRFQGSRAEGYDYTITASANGYLPYTDPAVIKAGQPLPQQIGMRIEPPKTGSAKIFVSYPTPLPAGTTITLTSPDGKTKKPVAANQEITGLTLGEWTIEIKAPDYMTYFGTVKVPATGIGYSESISLNLTAEAVARKEQELRDAIYKIPTTQAAAVSAQKKIYTGLTVGAGEVRGTIPFDEENNAEDRFLESVGKKFFASLNACFGTKNTGLMGKFYNEYAGEPIDIYYTIQVPAGTNDQARVSAVTNFKYKGGINESAVLALTQDLQYTRSGFQRFDVPYTVYVKVTFTFTSDGDTYNADPVITVLVKF